MQWRALKTNHVSNGKMSFKCKDPDTALKLFFFLQALCDEKLIEDINDTKMEGEEIKI